MVKETLMNADNKDPNLSAEPPRDTGRFLIGSIKALDRVCAGSPFQRPLNCEREDSSSRLQQFEGNVTKFQT